MDCKTRGATEGSVSIMCPDDTVRWSNCDDCRPDRWFKFAGMHQCTKYLSTRLGCIRHMVSSFV